MPVICSFVVEREIITPVSARQVGMNQTTDSYSRNIQNQIANVQKQLQV